MCHEMSCIICTLPAFFWPHPSVTPLTCIPSSRIVPSFVRQTCYIAEEAFAGGVFPVMFSEELDPCPSSTEFHTLYEAEYGEIAVVTAASLTSSGCPEGWLYSKETDHCYFKSLNTAKSANKDDAAVLCEAEGGWVIAMETEVRGGVLIFFVQALFLMRVNYTSDQRHCFLSKGGCVFLTEPFEVFL